MAEAPPSAREPAGDPLVQRYRPAAGQAPAAERPGVGKAVKELGGRKDGTDPTRFGDWEKNGRCIDF